MSLTIPPGSTNISNKIWNSSDGVEQMGSNFFAKSAQKFQKVPKSTNAPNITIAIPDAPLRGAISILVVIFGAFVLLRTMH